jgi:hypothetical protein
MSVSRNQTHVPLSGLYSSAQHSAATNVAVLCITDDQQFSSICYSRWYLHILLQRLQKITGYDRRWILDNSFPSLLNKSLWRVPSYILKDFLCTMSIVCDQRAYIQRKLYTTLIVDAAAFTKDTQTDRQTDRHTHTHTHTHTRSLTHSMKQSHTWEAKRFSASQEISRILWIRKFITSFTSARHLSLTWTSSIPIQSMPPHPISWRSSLILSCHLRLCLFPFQVFSPNPVYASPLPHTCYVSRPHTHAHTHTHTHKTEFMTDGCVSVLIRPLSNSNVCLQVGSLDKTN